MPPVNQIDIVTAAPKANETAPIKTAELQKPVTDNLNALAQVEKNIHDSAEIIIRPDASETPEFKYDTGEREGNGAMYYESDHGKLVNKKKKKVEKKLPKETEEEKKFGHGFDIRV
jgi:hypothetical protein